MKSYLKRIILYLIGLFIMGIGVAFSFQSNLGSSPISSIPYSFYMIWGINVGIATIILHAIFVFIEYLLLREYFEARFLLQIVVGVFFGIFTDAGMYVVSFFPLSTSLLTSLIYLAISIILVAFGLFLYIPQNIVQLAGEGVMQAIAIVTKKQFSKIKVYFDSTMVVISFFMCGLLMNNWFASVNLGTILSAILIGITVRYITKAYMKITGKTVDLKKM